MDQVANPLYDTASSEPETKTTVLKTVKVVQLTLSYEHNQYGEIENNRLNVNLPLTSFSAIELNRNRVSRKVLNNKVTMEIQDKGITVKEVICADRFYDVDHCYKIILIDRSASSRALLYSMKFYSYY